jgi:hypothetical protein
MRLVIVRSDAAGNVSLASEQVFGDPAEAAAVLAGCYTSGAVDSGSTCYALDLDAAMPVVVVAREASQDEPAQVEEPYAEAVLEAAADDVAPEPPAFESLPEADTDVHVEVSAEADMGTGDAEAEGESGEWPWDLPAGEAPDVPEPPAAEEPALADAPGASLSDDLVIIEDLPADTPDEEAAVEQAEPAEEPEADIAADELPQTEAAAAAPADEAAEQSGIAEPQGVIELEVPVSDDEAIAAVLAADDPAYEPGILNMAQYTCDDCVYVNTCPNQHQKAPAECGSFQWRSV